MALTPAQATLIAKAVEGLAKMIREDRSARYDLNAKWSLPPLAWKAWKRSQVFDNGLLRIAPSPNFPGYVDITIRPFKSTRTRNILDGATFAPDNPKWGVLAAACLHDVIYYCFADLQRETGLTRKQIRDFADPAFYSVMVAVGNRPALARLYLVGIRLGFPLYDTFLRRLFASLAVAVSLSLAASGCALVAVPQPGDDGTFLQGATVEAPNITPSFLDGTE